MADRLRTGLLVSLLALSGSLYAACGDDALKLSDVQGAEASSPLVGKSVTVEGIITLDSRHPEGWQGFYLQQPDGETDNDPDTSDALFVYTDLTGGTEGDRVRVSGKVKEYHGLTELVRIIGITVCGPGRLPRPVPVQLPWPDQRMPEHLENMRVTLSQPMTLVGHYSFERYGELILAEALQITPTEVYSPGPEARALAAKQSLNRLYLDDGRRTRNPDPLPWPASHLDDGDPFRAGDTLTELNGILDYRFGKWRLQPTGEPEISAPGDRPKAPPRGADTTLRVVTLNLGNYFNGDGKGGGFGDSRGARNQEQLTRQTSRLTATLTAMNPDVIAAVEMENDHYGDRSAIAMLATALGPDWQFVTTPGTTGTDAIRTDLLYRVDRARVIGQPVRLTRGVFSQRGRPPVAQLFQPVEGNRQAVVRIVVAHFKSKSCGGASGAEKDQNDGQGCYARRRARAADALIEWLGEMREPVLEEGTFAGNLITGDLNSYAREWPIQQLEKAGLINLVRAGHECSINDCLQTTYRYQGRQGSLDYSLGPAPLLDRLVGAGVWRINAEEFPAIGFQGSISASADSPWRSSDHNPVYTDLAL